MSTIPNKALADLIPETEKVLDLSTAATDTAFRSQIENIDPVDEILDTSLKDKLLEDKTTQDILQALEKKSYQKKFEEQYPGIDLSTLSAAKKQSKYPLQAKKGNLFPIFGINAINKVLDHFDENLQHQGNKEIYNKMTKEKIELYHKEDKTNFKKVEEDNMEDFIKNIRNCDQCKMVEELKSSGTLKGRLTELHSEDDIIKALDFADKLHTGEYLGEHDYVSKLTSLFYRLQGCMEQTEELGRLSRYRVQGEYEYMLLMSYLSI